MTTQSLQVAIAGATSLRGKDLKECLEESGFPADIRLLDEETAAGTLTEVAGEPAIVQPVDEDSFAHMRFAFFTGSAPFAAQHAGEAERAGAAVIDLTGALGAEPGARRWITALDGLLPAATASAAVPSTAAAAGPGKSKGRLSVCLSPSTAAIVACSFSAALRELAPTRLAIVFFWPVSERGQSGVEELQNQTINLLAIQSMPREVFDTQVAFNLLHRWGPESGERLAETRAALDREVRGYLAGRSTVPAMALVQAPVFFGLAFSVYAEFSAPLDTQAAAARLEAAGIRVVSGDEPEPSNVSVAGSSQIAVRGAQADPGVEGGYWFWGAADNLRLATSNAVRIAEKLLAS